MTEFLRFLCFYQSPVLLLFIISCPEEQQHWRTLGGVIHWLSPLAMELLAGGGGNIWATRPNWFLWTGISESGAERELQSPASPGNDPNLIIFFVSGRGLKLKEIVGEQSTATYWDLDWTFNNCRHSTWDLALVRHLLLHWSLLTTNVIDIIGVGGVVVPSVMEEECCGKVINI